MTGEEIGDGVVADTQRARKEQSSQPDEEPTYDRPPQEMKRELGEPILRGVDQPGQKTRSKTGDDPDRHRARQLLP